MKARFYCKCGHYFSLRRELTEHIGIQNPHWPRTNPADKHQEITKQQWSDARIASYKSLREG